MVQAGDIEVDRSEGESRRLVAFLRTGEKDALEMHKNTQPEREACEQEYGISRGNSVQEAMHL